MTGWIIFGCILLILIFLFTRPISVTFIYEKAVELIAKVSVFTVFRYPPDPIKQAKREKKLAKRAQKAEKRKKAAEEKAAKKAEKAKKKPSGEKKPAKKTGSPEAKAQSPAEKPAENGAESSASPKEKAEKAQSGEKATDGMKIPGLSSLPDMDGIKRLIAAASPPIKRIFKKIRIRDVYIDLVTASDDAAVTALKYGGLCAAVYSAHEWAKTYLDVKTGEINIEADFHSEKDDFFVYFTVKLRVCTAVFCGLWLAIKVTGALNGDKKPNKNGHRVKPKKERKK